MIPPELQTRTFRPYVSPSFSSNGAAASPSSYPYLRSPSSSRSAPGSASASAGSFSHNLRMAVALVPCGAILLDLGGTAVAATLTVGLMVSYILDSMKLKTGGFFGVWASLVAAQIAFFFTADIYSFNSLPLSALAALLCAFTTFLIGVWASLQFRWIHLENASVAAALERVLFACAPFPAAALVAWAAVAAVGFSASASYYLMAWNCLLYWVYSIPRASGLNAKQASKFHGGHATSDTFILGHLESCVHSLHLLFLPITFHVATHHRGGLMVSDLLLLFFIPFLFQLYASTRGALWWVTQTSADQIRRTNGPIAVLVIVICLEVRVIFHSFGRYIQVPAPFSYILVTTAMLGAAGGGGALSLGLVSDATSSLAFTALTLLVSAAGALLIGFPILFIPLPCVAGFYLARFLTKKSLTSYFAFVVLGSLMVMWFVMHNFWDLNIWIAGMSLKSFCKLITGSVIVAMAVPGLALLPANLAFLTEVGLISHTLLLCHIENRFFNYSGMYYYGFDEEVMYPSYMVILTTFVGLALTRRLSADRRIGAKAVWILTCLYLSKLAMLFILSKSVVWLTALLLLAVSPPLLLYGDRSRMGSKMKPLQAYAHAGVVALSVWFCRETIFEALQWWNGRAPSDGLLLGFCIVLTGLACVPIVALHFSHAMVAKRYLVLIVATGLLFILMQPPIPLSWAYRSDLIKAARQSVDDISIYGFVAPKPTWPAWLLIAALLLTLAAITSIIPIKYVVEVRLLYSVAMGLALGIYIAAEYFLQAAVLHVAIMVCASVFVVFTHFPSASSTKLLPWVFALLVALFPVTYLLEGHVRFTSILSDEDRKLSTFLAVEGARMSLLGLYAAIFMLVALGIKYELSLLMRERSGGGAGERHAHSAPPPRMRFMQQRRVTNFAIKRMAAEGAWMPAVGNVATVMCFMICLVLNATFTGGSNQGIFLLAPILLLLNQDSDFVAGFGDKQRYFPVTVVISVYLVVTALYSVWEDVWHGNAGWGFEIGGPDWFFAVKNLALLILTFPSHILFNRFVWGDVKQTNSMTRLITMPLNLPSIIITDVLKIRILGILGIIYTLAQYLISRQHHLSGLKYI